MAARSLFLALTRSRGRSLAILRPLSSGGAAGADIVADSPSPASSSSSSSSSDCALNDLRSQIFRLRFPKRSATNLLQRWVAEGNTVTLAELRKLARDLNRDQRYKHALEISEWMVTHSEFLLSDHDYAIRIDLITKVFGTNSAEEFFEGLPSSAKTAETYTALLHSFASAKQTERAEKFFERMKESNVMLNALAFNEMMTLYMSVGQFDKIPLVVEELKKENVPLDLFTYNLWVSVSAAALNIDGVKRILHEMSTNHNCTDGWRTYVNMTRIYMSAGRLAYSNDSPVPADEKVTQREWITYDFLIILYTGLGHKERVTEIWKSLKKSAPVLGSRDYLCILSSYVMNGQLKEAEECLDEWKKYVQDFDLEACRRLSDAFLEVNLTEEAELLLKLLRKKRLWTY